MRTRLDREAADAALKRAARNAVSGPEAVRAGRFVRRDAIAGRVTDTVKPAKTVASKPPK